MNSPNPAPTPSVLVRTEISQPGKAPSTRIIDWNNRTAVKSFASSARKALMAGGRVVSEAVKL